MKIWTVSEAYQDANSDEEISAYTVLSKSHEEAIDNLRKMIRERVSDFYWDCDDTDEDEITDMVIGIIESHDGRGWYRWINSQSHYSWNVASHEMEEK